MSTEWEKQPEEFGDEDSLFEGEDELEEQWMAEWEEADRHAVEVLRNALRRYRRKPPPAEQLTAAAASVRTGLKERGHPLAWVQQAAGMTVKAASENDDDELLIGLAAATISPPEETGLDIEEEALLISLEPADWLGAIVSVVREGEGAKASPHALVEGIRNCPEVTLESDLDAEEASHIDAAFWIVALPWNALGITDRDQRLTELGVWILPRALARAWNGDFDQV